MPDFDTDYQRYPVCPYCGYNHRDAWEWPFDGAEDDLDHDCASCDKPFRCSRNIIVEYSTKPIEEPNQS
jgi:hypothetical protein